MQSIEWLHRFYKWVSETANRTKIAKTKSIFLNQDRKAVAAFDTNGQPILFMPTEGGSGYETVYPELLENEETAAFIEQLGITAPSLKHEIYNKILPRYKDGVSINTRPHFKKFFQYYNKCSQSEAKSFITLIKEYDFVLYRSEGNNTQYRGKANTLYFPNETLKKWFQSKPDTNFVSFDEYMQLVGEDKKEELVVFFTDLGVKDVPRILSRELSWQEAHEIQGTWPYSSRGHSWTEKLIDGCKELIETIVAEQDLELSCLVWSQLLKFVEYGYLKDNYYWSRENVLYGRYEYFYYNSQSKTFESSEAKRLRTQPWLVNCNGEFGSANELTVQTLHSQYDLSSDEAAELIGLLGIKEEVEETEDEEVDITSYAESLGLSDEEQRQALLEYAKRKKATEVSDTDEDEEDEDLIEDEPEETVPDVTPSVKRVVKEISKRATSAPRERIKQQDAGAEEAQLDEDDYSKPTVDISKKIEKVKEQAEREIKEIAHLEDLKQQVQEADKYSYGWFKALLELESINSGENNTNSREISILFSKVEREEGTSRTLVLKHPSRYIPQFMEDC